MSTHMSARVLSTAATGLPRPAWGTPSIAALPRGFPALKSKRAHAVSAVLPPLPCHPPTCPSALSFLLSLPLPPLPKRHLLQHQEESQFLPPQQTLRLTLPSSTSPPSSGKFYTFSNCLVSASPQRDYHFSEARTLPPFGVSAEGSAYSSLSGTCRNK